MEQLESLRKKTTGGTSYWLAREIGPILGYPVWAKFLPVIEKARTACAGTGVDASHHFAQTDKVMALGKGGSFRGLNMIFRVDG